MSEVTRILEAAQQGDPKAVDDLMTLVYQELRMLAAGKMAGEPPGHTLQPTALVHEAWLRLVGKENKVRFRNRAHFFGAAAEAMRRILIERARRKQAAKRGAGSTPLNLDEIEVACPAANDEELLCLNAALEKFAIEHKRKAELVKLRFFIGMNYREAAASLNIAVPTAKQWWKFARAWLEVEMSQTPHP